MSGRSAALHRSGAAIVFAAFTLFADATTAQELTLDDAIVLALKSNRTVQNAALESAKVDDLKASLKTQLLPNIRLYGLAAQPLSPFDFIVSKGALGVDSLSGPIPSSDAKLGSVSHPFALFAASVVQPLSSIPTIKKGLGLLDIQKKLAEEQMRLERQMLVRDVRLLYYGIQSVQGSLHAAQESVRLFREVTRITSEYAEKRQVLDVDYLEAQMHLAKATESVLDLENQRETLKAKLNHKLGRSVVSEFTVPDIPATADASLPESLQDPAEARQRALAQRPEARQAQLKIEQAKSEMHIARAGFDPTIAAQFVGMEATPVGSLLPRQIGIAGVSVTWEPFTWGRKKRDLSVRRRELEEAVNREEEAKGAVAIDVAEQQRRLQLAAARVHVASLGRQVAVESLRVAQKQYEVQFSLLKTVLQAQASLESANADYQRGLSEVWSARAEYQRALGEEQ